MNLPALRTNVWVRSTSSSTEAVLAALKGALIGKEFCEIFCTNGNFTESFRKMPKQTKRASQRRCGSDLVARLTTLYVAESCHDPFAQHLPLHGFYKRSTAICTQSEPRMTWRLSVARTLPRSLQPLLFSWWSNIANLAKKHPTQPYSTYRNL